MPNVKGAVLTDRDRALLTYVGIARYASADHVHRLIAPGHSKKLVYRRLAKLCLPGGRLGQGACLRRLQYRRAEGTGVPVWALTPYGRSLVAPLVPWLPPPAAHDVGHRFLEHTLLLNDVFLWLVLALRRSETAPLAELPFRWLSEGDEVLQFRALGRRLGESYQTILKPDAILEVPGSRRRVFIEAETGTQSIVTSHPERTGAVIAKLQRYQQFFSLRAGDLEATWYRRSFRDDLPPRLLFLVHSPERRQRVEKAVKDALPTHALPFKVLVFTFDEAAGKLLSYFEDFLAQRRRAAAPPPSPTATPSAPSKSPSAPAAPPRPSPPRFALAVNEPELRRQRDGLDPLRSESLSMTFGALMDWWWELKGKTLRSHSARSYIEKHLRHTLGPLPLREVTSARIQRLLADKSKELAPKSLNDLRAFVFNFFQVARKPGGPWEGRPNPVADVERFKVTPRPRKVLAVDEYEAVLAEVPRRWEGPVATGLYAGLREGEIFGLLKEDVDLKAGVLMVWRSWEAPRTKDGKAVPIPIAAPLRARLEAALRSPGELLFPRRDGSMQPRSLRLGRMLRAAIGRAGLVEAWLHRCRAPGCGHEARSQKATPLERCPRCGKPGVWAKPIPRHVTFHGTRHSFGTAVVRGAGTAVAQKALRHSDVRLTIHTYGHLDDRDVREGITRAFGGAARAPDEVPPETSEPEKPRARTAGGLPTPPPSDPAAWKFAPGTAGKNPQPRGTPSESAKPPSRTDARTARSAASARTTCSSAA